MQSLHCCKPNHFLASEIVHRSILFRYNLSNLGMCSIKLMSNNLVPAVCVYIVFNPTNYTNQPTFNSLSGLMQVSKTWLLDKDRYQIGIIPSQFPAFPHLKFASFSLKPWNVSPTPQSIQFASAHLRHKFERKLRKPHRATLSSRIMFAHFRQKSGKSLGELRMS